MTVWRLLVAPLPMRQVDDSSSSDLVALGVGLVLAPCGVMHSPDLHRSSRVLLTMRWLRAQWFHLAWMLVHRLVRVMFSRAISLVALLAVAGLSIGLVALPNATNCHFGSRVDTTRLSVQIAIESYAYWTLETGRECPAGLNELKKFGGRTKDAWGNELIMLCGDAAPRSAPHGFAVMSSGEDGHFSTKDDIVSWR